MRTLRRVGLCVAILSGALSYLYLEKTNALRRAATTVVTVPAADLFPRETLVFCALHGVDKCFASVERWWRKFEGTAMHQALRFAWQVKSRRLPRAARALLDQCEREMDKVEARFGYRPTTQDFFNAYGRFTAVGLLPQAKKQRPGFLAVVRLPSGEAQKTLEIQLDGSDVRRHGEFEGFPVFVEERRGAPSLFFGLGGGYVFVADELANLEASLLRLQAVSRGEVPAPSLSSDAAFQRGVPNPWDSTRFVAYTKRELDFGAWKRELQPLVDLIGSAFVLAPEDDAVAFSAAEDPETESLVVRSSIPQPPRREWAEIFPSGMVAVDESVPVHPSSLRAAYGPGMKRFHERQLWKEIHAFLANPKRVRQLIAEALGTWFRPAPELLERLPRDAEFLASVCKQLQSAATFASPISTASGSKLYTASDGTETLEGVIAAEMNPLATFAAAGVLELVAENAPRVVKHRRFGTVMTWQPDPGFVHAMIASHPGAVTLDRALVEKYVPMVLVGSGSFFLVFGRNLSMEIIALMNGKSTQSLAKDPLFQEARSSVRPGHFTMRYRRPGVLSRAVWNLVNGWLNAGLDNLDVPAEAKVWMRPWLAAFRYAVDREQHVRAQIATRYPDPDKPSSQVTLVDREAEKRFPYATLSAKPPRIIQLLPSRTYWMEMGRLQLKDFYDGTLSEILAALPDDRPQEYYRRQMDKELPLWRDIENGLLRNVRGEFGMAMTLPATRGRATSPVAGVVKRLPGFVVFMEPERPDDAFRAVGQLFDALRWQLQDYGARLERRGDPMAQAFRKVELVRQERNGHPVILLELHVALPDLDTLRFGALERDGLVVVATTGDLLDFMVSTPAGGRQTLASRIAKELPADTVPEAVSCLSLVDESGVLHHARLWLEPLVPMAAGFTLGGYRGRAPRERFIAHARGWTRVLDLTEDLFRPTAWHVAYTRRVKERFESEKVRAWPRTD